MKLSLLLTLAAMTAQAQVSESFRARVEMRESGGKNVAGRNSEIGPMQLKRAAWIDANRYRKSIGLPQIPYSKVWDAPSNRVMGKSYLDLQQARLRKHLKSEPTEAQIEAAYQLGFAGFKRSKT